MLSGPVSTIRRARTLRQQLNLPEAMLWKILRSRPNGFKFRRQQVAGPYVVDFYCHAARLAIEIDGESHNRGNQPSIDEERDAYLRHNGVSVLRIPAKDVLGEPDAVLRQILASASVPPLHHAAPFDVACGVAQDRHGPPPLKGED